MSGYSEYKAQMNSKKPKKKKDKTLKIKTKGKGKARKVAEKTLKENLRHEYSASLTVKGDVSYCAGVIVELDESFGKFSGRYIIDKVTHNIDSEYTCSLELLKVGAKENAEQKAKQQAKKEQLEKERLKKKKSEKKATLKNNKQEVRGGYVGYRQTRGN